MSDVAWKWLTLVARLILGLVFAWAGWVKLQDPQAFADSISTVAILPTALINPLALGLPVLELAPGLLLLAGIRRRACGGLAPMVSAVFAVALAQALLRGLVVDCGCSGGGVPSFGKNLLALGRDAGLAGLAWVVMWRADREVG